MTQEKQSPKALGRRQFLKSAGAAGAIATSGAVLAQDSKPPLASKDDLGIAEKLIGLNYTNDERAVIYDGIEGMVDRIRTRRTNAPLENKDTPALIFDPRLPERKYPAQKNTVTLAASGAGAVPNDTDVAFAPVWKQAEWLRTKKITSAKLTEIYLSRIEKYGPKLECFVTVMADSARKEAQNADKEIQNGKYRGPLHGIPYGLKDLTDTAGVKTTWGAEPYKDRVPTEDAELVIRLRDAGAVLLGKTTLGALAYGDRWFGGLTRNPWNTEEGSSGSSAGSASSAAAALCAFTIGTETLGSIVSPTTRCGATGLRPTFGRIPRSGAMALCWSLDKFGPICRSVEDTALVLSALNGAHEDDPSSLDHGFNYNGSDAAKGVKIGYSPAWFEQGTKSDKEALKKLKKMGFELKEVSLPNMPYGSLITTLEVEAAAAFEELTLSNRDDLMKWQEPQAWPNTFRGAHFHSAVEALQVDRFRRKVMQEMAKIYDEVDLLISPNFAAGLLLITNYTGTPSLTLPIAMEKRQITERIGGPKLDSDRDPVNLPHTITLWGNMFREDQIIAVGRMLEESFRFDKNRPAL